MSNLPFISHSKPSISAEDLRAVESILRAGMISSGEKLSEFERSVGNYLGFGPAAITGSGTAALKATLEGLHIKRDDEVILPTYVCGAVADAVLGAGGVPVLCDIGEEWCMTPESVVSKVSRKTKAIVLVHTFGIRADVEAFSNFDVPIIEDCCQALGSTGNERRIGSSGYAAVYSFHATKCIATGEGGAVVSADEDFIDRIRTRIRKRLDGGPLTDLQAALGVSQLERYPSMLARRAAIAQRYLESLPRELMVKTVRISHRSMFFRFPITLARPFEDLERFCLKKNIAVRRGVDQLIHRTMGMVDNDFPMALRCFEKTASLPIYPALQADQIERVIDAVSAWFHGAGSVPR